MKKKIREILHSVYDIRNDNDSFSLFDSAINTIDNFLEANHFPNSGYYYKKLKEITEIRDDLESWESYSDHKTHIALQRQIYQLSYKIIHENKKIFIVHGRNENIRDKVSSFLGRLKLDYVILEQEFNGGRTIIEKFLKSSDDCEYAIILFSADDIGKLKNSNSEFKFRPRQNVILELGFFLNKLGRENITILHDDENKIEKPSDFNGIVYEPFDKNGAWKSKLIKEFKHANIYIDPKLELKV